MTTQTDSKSLRDTARDETATLIASDKVEGTAVYGADSEKIGRIENVMIDKLSGKVAYAGYERRCFITGGVPQGFGTCLGGHLRTS